MHGDRLRIQNPNWKFYWAGWTGSIYELQHHGWDISVDYQHHMMAYRFAFRHPDLRMYGLTSAIDDIGPGYTMLGNNNDVTIPVTHIATDLRIQTMEAQPLTGFQPLVENAHPIYQPMSEIKSMEDCNIFTPLEDIQEIVVAEESTLDLLDQLLANQDEKQKEIREKRRKKFRKLERNIANDFVRYEQEEADRAKYRSVAKIIGVST